MKLPTIFLLTLCLFGATALCQNKGKGKGKKTKKQVHKAVPLLKARGDFKTKLIDTVKSDEPMDVPPEDSAFKIVRYATELGDMLAYLTKKPDLEGGEKVPAIVWLTGGIPPAGPGSYLWEETKLSNEQSARIYRLRGIEMMFPTVRGTVKENPGQYEGLYGEVEDVIAAGKYLKSLDYIDPDRVYLGGHSSGGTLALLTATATDEFAGVISLGPTDDHYGEEDSPYEWKSKEINFRSPIKHLAAIRTPTYIIEGFDDSYSVNQLGKANKNPMVKCSIVAQGDHFNIIHSVNSLFSRAILNSEDGKLTFDEGAIAKCYMKDKQRRREVSDLESLAEYRKKGVLLDGPKMLTFYFLARQKDAFDAIGIKGFKKGEVTAHKNSSGKEYYVVRLKKEIDVTDLQQLFEVTKKMSDDAYLSEVTYDNWTLK